MGTGVTWENETEAILRQIKWHFLDLLIDNLVTCCQESQTAAATSKSWGEHMDSPQTQGGSSGWGVYPPAAQPPPLWLQGQQEEAGHRKQPIFWVPPKQHHFSAPIRDRILGLKNPTSGPEYFQSPYADLYNFNCTKFEHWKWKTGGKLHEGDWYDVRKQSENAIFLFCFNFDELTFERWPSLVTRR